MRQNKIMKKISQVLDSVERIAGEDGKPVLPLFITESVSKLYYRDKDKDKRRGGRGWRHRHSVDRVLFSGI